VSRYFGAHMSIAGGHHRAAEAAARIGANTLQVFTKSTNQWAARPLTDAQIAAFHESLRTHGLDRPVGHTSYLINIASPDTALAAKSIDSLTEELQRAEALGLTDLVLHPGAHVGEGEEAGLRTAAQSLDEVLRRTAGVACRIALETTAGQGSCLGHRFEHLAFLRQNVAAPERLSVCIDTCHILAAGYPLDDPDRYNEIIDEMLQRIGPNVVAVWHLNDSLKGRGSRVDRHAGIGRGELGIEPFRKILNDPRFVDLPMILETPKGLEDGVELDVINLGLLRDLAGLGSDTRPGKANTTRGGARSA
jgi:deoxyribonuclease-4